MILMKRTSWLVATLVTFSSAFAQTQFLPLGYLDSSGSVSEANAISRDGTKIVGYSTANLTANQSVWWTTSGIMRLSGQQDWYANNAWDVSAEGNVIVGERSFGGTEEAFYWTPATQLQLVPFPETLRASTARGVTGSGQVIVGTATVVDIIDTHSYKAFRWDRSQAAAVYLPVYSRTISNCFALAISDDGRRVVGAVQTSLSTYAAARWDDGGTPVLFSKAADTVVAVTANAISPDGSIIVGSGLNTANSQGVAFKWTAADGVVALPNPTTGYYAIVGATANDISGDGRVVVGYGENAAGNQEAIFWVDGQPFRVADVAFAAGVLPPQWEPFTAYGTDYFGNLICGYGRATSGKLEGYVLVIDATPARPPLEAPTIRSSYNRANGTLTIRYPTVPGFRYRVRGGSDVESLAPLGNWSAGAGIEQEFSAAAAITGGAARFFLNVEIAPN